MKRAAPENVEEKSVGSTAANGRIIATVALGSALGGSTRYLLELAVASLWSGGFPLGILLINVSGSALIGWLAASMLASAAPKQQEWKRHFLMAGFCGGYTTFSVLSLDTLLLIQHSPALALFNMSGTVVLCLFAALLAYRIVAGPGSDGPQRGC